jgi:hypothetical protein
MFVIAIIFRCYSLTPHTNNKKFFNIEKPLQSLLSNLSLANEKKLIKGWIQK